MSSSLDEDSADRGSVGEAAAGLLLLPMDPPLVAAAVEGALAALPSAAEATAPVHSAPAAQNVTTYCAPCDKEFGHSYQFQVHLKGRAHLDVVKNIERDRARREGGKLKPTQQQQPAAVASAFFAMFAGVKPVTSAALAVALDDDSGNGGSRAGGGAPRLVAAASSAGDACGTGINVSAGCSGADNSIDSLAGGGN